MSERHESNINRKQPLRGAAIMTILYRPNIKWQWIKQQHEEEKEEEHDHDNDIVEKEEEVFFSRMDQRSFH